MARLVDADALINKIQEEKKKNEYSEVTLQVINLFVEMLEEQPTAYDVEKVVEALEEQQEYYSFDMDSDLDCAKYKAYKNAIDIVKRGGVDGC